MKKENMFTNISTIDKVLKKERNILLRKIAKCESNSKLNYLNGKLEMINYFIFLTKKIVSDTNELNDNNKEYCLIRL